MKPFITTAETMEEQYLDLLRHIVAHGKKRPDRTGTGTLSVFGASLVHDLHQSFPAITTKRLFWRGVKTELEWFLRGDTNASWLQQRDITIWDEWAREGGELGPVYGKQWRCWEAADGSCHDQIANVIHQLKTNPYSRRILVSAWNVGDLARMALEPCHILFQFYVEDVEGQKSRLCCSVYQRSADMFLGVPFNLASYALLTHLIAKVCNLDVGHLYYTFGDAHIYLDHREQVDIQLGRTPFAPPQLALAEELTCIDDFKAEQARLVGYEHHGTLQGAVSV